MNVFSFPELYIKKIICCYRCYLLLRRIDSNFLLFKGTLVNLNLQKRNIVVVEREEKKIMVLVSLKKLKRILKIGNRDHQDGSLFPGIQRKIRDGQLGHLIKRKVNQYRSLKKKPNLMEKKSPVPLKVHVGDPETNPRATVITRDLDQRRDLNPVDAVASDLGLNLGKTK